jgi:hypothetical protein
MKRADLEHILRASKSVTGETEFIVVGSQAILGEFPDAPRALRESMEADLYPRHRPQLAAKIEGSLGRYSQFDQTFGYHADGVSPTTATLPAGWEDRLVKLTNDNTAGAIGWCLEVHDLAISKLVAGREKDLEYLRCLINHRMVQPATLQARLRDSALPPNQAELAAARLTRLLNEP